MVGNLQMTHFARAKPTAIEEQEYVLFWVAVVGHLEDLGHLDLDAALLPALSNQRLLGRLPLFELSAWELPHPG